MVSYNPVLNLQINKIVNTDSNVFNIIQSVCFDELSETDKTLIE